MSGHDRKAYFKVFIMLGILTGIEVAIPTLAKKYHGQFGAKEAGLFFSFIPHWSSTALYLLSIIKAGLVGLFFMHLRYETKWLKFIALLPAIAGFLALMICAEAFYRYFYCALNVSEPLMAAVKQ